jgi:capsular polysaccharide biosynthesis protein
MEKNTNPRLSQASLTSMQPAAAPARPAAAQPVQPPAPGAPDLGAMISRVFAHWPVVIITMVVGAVVTLQVVRTRKATYKSETVIYYREGIAKSVTGPTESLDTVRALGTKLKETLLAQQTLRKIIDEFHLYPEIVAKSGYADAVDQMRKKTEFKSRSTDTFAISFEGFEREQAQQVCARMASLLVAENAKRLQDESKNTTEFLEAEKKRSDEELDRIERDISQFIQVHPEFSTAKEGLGSETQALKQQADDDEKKQRIRLQGKGPRRGRADPAVPAAAGVPASDRAPAVDPVLISNRTQAYTELFAAKKDLDDKRLRFTEQHPDVRTAAERVATAEAAVQRANDAIAAAQPPREEAPPPKKAPSPLAEDPYAEPSAKPVATAVAAAADPDRDAKEKHHPKAVDPDQENKVVSLEVEWARLGRSLGLARSHQADLESKLYRAEMVASTAESGYGTSIAVLDPAYKPSGPSNAPNKTVVMMGLAASIAVGLFFSAAWGLFLDDRLFAASEIEASVMVPVLGVVPRSKAKIKRREKGAPGDKQRGASRG